MMQLAHRALALRLVLLCLARAQDEDEAEPVLEFKGYDGLSEVVRDKCDGADGRYAKKHYARCCGKARYMDREAICEKAKPYMDPDLRTPAWPKVKPRVSDQCMACARLVDNFDMGLLPRLRDRHEQLARSHSRTKHARTAGIGELEEIVEEEVDRICQWPRTHHNVKVCAFECTQQRSGPPMRAPCAARAQVRKHCWRLVEDRTEEIVDAVSVWARGKLEAMPVGALPAPSGEGQAATGTAISVAAWGNAKAGGQYSLPLDASLAEEVRAPAPGRHFRTAPLTARRAPLRQLRPEICARKLDECTDYDLWELKDQDTDERGKLELAAVQGHQEDKPLESQMPVANQHGPLIILTAADFVERVVKDGETTDYLVYFYFPGRWNETDDTHARLRPKFIKLAQILDAPSSDGALAIGWMDCVFNQIPYPHGTHVAEDTIALYAAGESRKQAPNYLMSLSNGDIELEELITFVHEASSNIATLRCARARQPVRARHSATHNAHVGAGTWRSAETSWASRCSAKASNTPRSRRACSTTSPTCRQTT